MEISAMINELMTEMNAIETQIKTLTDRYEACKMAVDSLELLESTKPAQTQPVPVAETVHVELDAPEDKPVANARHSTSPKRVIQKDARGIVLHEYRSINAAARAFGWSYSSMVKYLETMSKDRQIAVRGSYLVLAA